MNLRHRLQVSVKNGDQHLDGIIFKQNNHVLKNQIKFSFTLKTALYALRTNILLLFTIHTMCFLLAFNMWAVLKYNT